MPRKATEIASAHDCNDERQQHAHFSAPSHAMRMILGFGAAAGRYFRFRQFRSNTSMPAGTATGMTTANRHEGAFAGQS